jgi:protein TonB
MSSIAIAHGLPDRPLPAKQPPANRGKIRKPYALLPFAEVPVGVPTHLQSNRKKLPGYAWLLIAAALITHAMIIWFATHHIAQPIKPKPRELALEFVAPKPPEPKIEPPKPQPPKPQVIKQAQVLPQIQQAAPQPSDNAAASSEPPVAVAPIVSEPPAPEPVTAAIGRAGYLNNPPPNYPPMAARQGWQGIVVLRVHVLSSGKPDVVEVQKSSGKKVLDDEAVRTVQSSWTYTPAKRGATPIDGWTTTPIEFRLDG